MNPPHGSHAMAAGSDDERALQEIDRDINRIWRELQELDKDLPPLKKPPQVPPNSSTPGSGQSKPKYERVKIQEYSIPKQSASPTRISSVPNNTANPSKTTSSYGGGTNEQSVKTSETTIPQTTASVPYGGKRTIWNMDSDQVRIPVIFLQIIINIFKYLRVRAMDQDSEGKTLINAHHV